jgi:TBC1 domain family protein 5
MRPVSEAEYEPWADGVGNALTFDRKHWRQLDDFHSLTDLKIHVSSHKAPQITAGLRSVCWKVLRPHRPSNLSSPWQIFLVFKTLDRSPWPTHLADSRKSYESLRTHYLRAIQNPDEFESSTDPLSENDEVHITSIQQRYEYIPNVDQY